MFHYMVFKTQFCSRTQLALNDIKVTLRSGSDTGFSSVLLGVWSSKGNVQVYNTFEYSHVRDIVNLFIFFAIMSIFGLFCFCFSIYYVYFWIVLHLFQYLLCLFLDCFAFVSVFIMSIFGLFCFCFSIYFHQLC